MKKDTEKELARAREILTEGGYTCVLYSPEKVYHSTLRGVRPLLDFLESGVDFRGFAAADKTVGLGAAHGYALLGVESVWARVMSTGAKTLLSERGIRAAAECEVPYIINRAGDGKCPIEAAVDGASSSEEALIRINATLEALSK